MPSVRAAPYSAIPSAERCDRASAGDAEVVTCTASLSGLKARAS